MLLSPIAHLDTIDSDALNRSLVAWGHKMGPLKRPGQEPWFHGLRAHGELVAVVAASRLVNATAAGFNRDTALELSRVCAARQDLCRVVLRLWREFVFPDLCRAHGYEWAISYQDAALHSGDLYRFDGWVRVAFSHSGTDRRSGRPGRDKWVWGWHADPIIRAAARRAPAAPQQDPVPTRQEVNRTKALL